MKAQRKRSHGNLPLTLLSVVALLGAFGCDPPTSEPAATTATATAEADGASELESYCTTICERTSHCGVELAKREAGKLDDALMSEIERGQKAEAKRCVSDCSRAPLDDAQRFQMERAQVCLGKTDCDELSRCMAAL